MSLREMCFAIPHHLVVLRGHTDVGKFMGIPAFVFMLPTVFADGILRALYGVNRETRIHVGEKKPTIRRHGLERFNRYCRDNMVELNIRRLKIFFVAIALQYEEQPYLDIWGREAGGRKQNKQTKSIPHLSFFTYVFRTKIDAPL